MPNANLEVEWLPPAFLVHVSHVVACGAEKQMIGVDALGRVTFVANVETARDWPVSALKKLAVRQHGFSVYAKRPVLSVVGGEIPEPTSCGWFVFERLIRIGRPHRVVSAIGRAKTALPPVHIRHKRSKAFRALFALDIDVRGLFCSGLDHAGIISTAHRTRQTVKHDAFDAQSRALAPPSRPFWRFW